jgi:hypothetical protein
MLAAILLGLFLYFGGGGGDLFGTLMTEHVKEQVKKNIPDEERRKLALKALSVVNDDINELNKQLSKELGQMEKLIKDYDSKPEDFDRLFSSVMTKRQKMTDKIWDDRTAVLQHVQADEWQAIISSARAEMEKEAAKKK